MKLGLGAWMAGLGILAGCDSGLAGFCAPGTPECTAPDSGIGIMPDAARPGDGSPGPDGSMGPPLDASDALACDPTAPPHVESCVIDDAYGVFVSPSGSDFNPGTRAAPVKTIAHGMDRAESTGKGDVFVCAGAFPEALVVDASRDGLRVYGGLDCGTWSYVATDVVTVAPPGGSALTIEGLTAGVTFEDMVLSAPDADPTSAGASSIAVFVSRSQNVAFQAVMMVAGRASDGAAGAPVGVQSDGGASGASNWFGTAPSYAQLNGNSATSAGSGTQNVCSCPDGAMSTGGQGGGVSDAGVPAPAPGAPAYGVDGGGMAGANFTACNRQGAGGDGADAPIATSDTASMTPGGLSASGWMPAAGTPGSDGKAGQGGGAGGNGPAGTGGGGGGACGGCGGAGGKPGSGAGSSIALLTYQSTVALMGCTLVAHNAGNGGPGGDGETGQAGSLTGGNGIQGGCPGGAGGSGSGGNGAQGGAGGMSLGIGFVGTAPTVEGSPVTSGPSLSGVVVGVAGTGGGPGGGGLPAATSVGQPQPGTGGSPGSPGVAQAVLGL